MSRYNIAILVSIPACLITCYSVFKKDHTKMLKLQSLDAIIFALSGLIQGGYTASLINLLATLRNYLNAVNKNTKLINSVIILITIGLGLLVNTHGLLGCVPIIATLEYAWLTYGTKNVKQIKWALALNSILWLIYDASLRLYPACVSDLFVLTSACVSLVKGYVTSGYVLEEAE